MLIGSSWCGRSDHVLTHTTNVGLYSSPHIYRGCVLSEDVLRIQLKNYKNNFVY